MRPPSASASSDISSHRFSSSTQHHGILNSPTSDEKVGLTSSGSRLTKASINWSVLRFCQRIDFDSWFMYGVLSESWSRVRCPWGDQDESMSTM